VTPSCSSCVIFMFAQELVLMQESLQTLKMAQQKFQESSDCMDRVKPETKDKEMLVPLTGSVSFSANQNQPPTLFSH
jgi:prefoldin subunit 5